jgi:hypothetical protein
MVWFIFSWNDFALEEMGVSSQHRAMLLINARLMRVVSQLHTL